METLRVWLEEILVKGSLNEAFIPFVLFLATLTTIVLLAFGGYYLTRFFLKNTFGRVAKKTTNQWDNLLIKHNFIESISLIVVFIILKVSTPTLLGTDAKSVAIMERLVDVFFVFVILKIVFSVLKATEDNLNSSQIYDEKPIESYFQLARILLTIVAFILGLSILVSKSPVYLLTAFGALSAVLLLIFKDTILGLVASVQISVNNMIRKGDWIEMAKFNADGQVISINLNTVKIKNWDNTISTVPTYYFVSESFKNYRGMQDSGGRRIKRSLKISINSVVFVSKEMRERFLKIELIKDYIESRQKDIEDYNAKFDINTAVLINGRRMTNIGVFRIYIEEYLKNNPRIRKDMTLIARLQTPDELGVPLQIYCFTNTVKMVEYEQIQSDIFDHLFAAAPYFGLELFQTPTGMDFKQGLKNFTSKTFPEEE